MNINLIGGKIKKLKQIFPKKAEDCQGNFLGVGFGATPPTSTLFRHAEGVEGIGKNRVIIEMLK